MKCVYQPPAGQYIFPKPVKGRIVFSSKISILKPFTGGKVSSFGDSFGCSDYFRLPVLAASGAGGVLAASGAGGVLAVSGAGGTLAASGAGGTLAEAWPG